MTVTPAGTAAAARGAGVTGVAGGHGFVDLVGAGAFLQSRSLSGRLVAVAAEVLGLALLAAGLAAGVALFYRWYARERVPGGLPVLVGLSGVALYLNSTRALRQVIGNTGDPLDETVAVVNIVTVLVGALAARVGADAGDRAGADVFAATSDRLEGEVSRVVQAVGRVITVELPEEIEDIVGYDPVPDETKAKLAGRSFVFPRRLTVAELRDRLVTRLKADYAVGHVDIDLAEDGSVEYLALGSRAAGIGPTLPPETSAVAVQADPAFAASAGDLVQVWRTNPPERVLTAELRGTVGDVVTLAVDAADTRVLDDTTRYRLVTLPVESRPDREYASLLRAADETMATATVAERAPLAGQPVGALDVTVVAIRPTDGPVEPLPGRDRVLAPGDTLYLVATPETIRRVDAAVRAESAPTGPEPASGSELPPDRRVDATTPVADEPEGNPRAVAGTPSPEAGGDVPPSGADEDVADTEAPEAEAGAGISDGEAPEAETDAGHGDDALDPGEPDLETLDEGETGTDNGEDDAGGADRGETADDWDGTSDRTGESEDEGEDRDGDGDSAEWLTLDEEEHGEGDGERDREGEPTVDDLADLPGTDPDDLAGTGGDGADSEDDQVDQTRDDGEDDDTRDDEDEQTDDEPGSTGRE